VLAIERRWADQGAGAVKLEAPGSIQGFDLEIRSARQIDILHNSPAVNEYWC
jgi:hypothetical protein